jgi:NTE family protein
MSKGPALCLSGGGYRAMLFHVGALWRLNDLAWLGRLHRISSVSGGSIAAGVLGLHWSRLGVTADAPAPGFPMVVDEVRRLAGMTIDAGAVLKSLLGLGSASRHIRDAYDKTLFHGATLQDLPDEPRFVIDATNVQSAALFRFSKPYARDWRVGEIANPRIPLAVAVAASSAFPPVLSPVVLEPEKYGCVFEPAPPYPARILLADGGVYDNLGIETAWKECGTILVSDAGGHAAPEPEPHRDWARHAYRVLAIIDDQVRSLRTRAVIASFARGHRAGAYFGIRTDIRDYGLADSLPCPLEQTTALAAIPTRLKALPPARQESLINWGYAVCDAAMRRHVDASLPAPSGFPYARGVCL